MLKKSTLYAAFLLAIFCRPALAIERLGVEFKIFQFPANAIPRIDGKANDWEMVPKEYAIGMDSFRTRWRTRDKHRSERLRT
jgi:hypothetical protein